MGDYMFKRERGVCDNEQWRGSVMFVVVGAVLVLGVLGVAISRLSGSGSGTEIQQNRFDSAYYAAQSGLEYLKYAETKKDADGNPFYEKIEDFVSAINGGSPYSLPSGNVIFSVTLSSVGAGGNSYVINSLVGSTKNVASGEKAANYALLSTGARTLTLKPTASENAKKFANLVFGASGTASMDSSGVVTGDAYANLIKLNGGSTVYGSIKQASATTALTLQGKYLGGAGEQMCSNSSVVITGDVTVEGNVYSKSGNVDIVNGDVKGNVYSAADVVIDRGSTVVGDVIALGSVDIKNGKVTGNVYAGGDVTLSSGSSVVGDVHSQKKVLINNGTVSGIVHYKTSFDYCSNKSCAYGGSDKTPVAPSYTFACDMNYQFPAHVVKSTTTDFILDWGSPYTGEKTIVARPNIDDYYVFRDFTTAGGTKLCLDLSNGGYITILVSRKVDLQSSQLYVRTDVSKSCFDNANLVDSVNEKFSSYASKVYIDSSGSGAISFNGGASWFGTIYAAGDINFSTSSAVIGGYYSSGGTTNRNGGGASLLVPAEYVLKYW